MQQRQIAGVTGAYVIVTCLFFAWGFITSLNDPVVTAVKGIFCLRASFQACSLLMERNHTLYKRCLWHHLLDQRKKLLDVERFQDHAFLSRQVFLHLRTRRQHNDLRMLTTGVKPAPDD